jgi:hypothetical protein
MWTRLALGAQIRSQECDEPAKWEEDDMTVKKEYTAPAIETEDVVEQTSLVCNATEPYERNGQVLNGLSGLNFATGLDCQIDVGKGDNWSNTEACEFAVNGPDAVVALS